MSTHAGGHARGQARRAESMPKSARVRDSGGQESLASPFISPAQVKAWTADNAPGVPSVGYHMATEAHADNIRRTGIDVARGNESDAFYGRGFYMAPRRDDPAFANTGDLPVVRAAIRMRNPLYLGYGNGNQNVVTFFNEASARHPDIATQVRSEVALRDSYGGEYLRDHAGTYYQAGAEILTRLALADNYDGIIVRTPNGIQEIVAIKPGTVRLIRE